METMLKAFTESFPDVVAPPGAREVFDCADRLFVHQSAYDTTRLQLIDWPARGAYPSDGARFKRNALLQPGELCRDDLLEADMVPVYPTVDSSVHDAIVSFDWCRWLRPRLRLVTPNLDPDLVYWIANDLATIALVRCLHRDADCFVNRCWAAYAAGYFPIGFDDSTSIHGLPLVLICNPRLSERPQPCGGARSKELGEQKRGQAG